MLPAARPSRVGRGRHQRVCHDSVRVTANVWLRRPSAEPTCFSAVAGRRSSRVSASRSNAGSLDARSRSSSRIMSLTSQTTMRRASTSRARGAGGDTGVALTVARP